MIDKKKGRPLGLKRTQESIDKQCASRKLNLLQGKISTLKGSHKQRYKK